MSISHHIEIPKLTAQVVTALLDNNILRKLVYLWKCIASLLIINGSNYDWDEQNIMSVNLVSTVIVV